MPWGIAAAAVGGIASSVISGNASKSAANTSANAAEAGTNAQLSMFDTTQADYKPQIQLGQGAANILANMFEGKNPNYSSFYDNPSFQFSLNQGKAAINKQAAANGSLYSSNTLGALGSYASGAASTQYNSYINQLLSMAGLGNAAASGVGSAATATGQGVANSLLNAGNAQANGILGQSNAFSNAFGSGGNMLSNYLTNPNAGGQYGGEFAPGVSTAVTYTPDTSGIADSISVPGG